MAGEFLACFLGVWLLCAAWAKVRDPGTFQDVVADYPRPLALSPVVVSRALPIVEVGLAAAMLSHDWRWVQPGLIGTGALIALASAAVLARRLRGERRFRCGCGGDLTEAHSAAAILTRNGLLLILTVVALSTPRGEPTPALPVVLTAAGLTTVLKLSAAGLRAWRYLIAWKASG